MPNRRSRLHHLRLGRRRRQKKKLTNDFPFSMRHGIKIRQRFLDMKKIFLITAGGNNEKTLDHLEKKKRKLKLVKNKIKSDKKCREARNERNGKN